MTVHNPVKLQQYANLAAQQTARFGAQYLARGGALTCLEDTTCDDRLAIAEFTDNAPAVAMFSDPEYHELAKVRHAATTTQLLTVIDGIDSPICPNRAFKQGA